MFRNLVFVFCATLASVLGNAFAADWSSGPPLNHARTLCGVVTDSAGHLYAIGGRVTWQPPTAVGSMEVLDLESDTGWLVLPYELNMPREAFGCVYVGGFIYAIGGRQCAQPACQWNPTMERFDTMNPEDGWELMPQLLNVPRSDMGTAVDRDGRIYLVGGNESDWSNSDVVERFDPHRPDLGWVQLCSMSQERGHAAVAVDDHGRIHVLGGAIDGAGLRTVEIFDPRSSSPCWTAGTSIPGELIATQNAAVARGADGRFYYMSGGIAGSGGFITQCLQYDPETESWESWVPLLVPGGGHSATVDDFGRLWVIGVHSSPSPTDVVQVMSAPLGAEEARPLSMDFNGDGTINVTDLLELLLRW